MNLIDLRSDTVTKPTPEMRIAMAQAEVGDDVYGDDPTVNKLQELAAQMAGKESALFVPSGTMGNLAAILAHCGRGDEAMLGDKAHTFLFEAGGISALGGIHSHQLPNQPDGSLLLADLEAGLRPDDDHFPPTRLILLENTHNRCGGTYQTPAYNKQVRDFSDQHGIKIHLDGARIFNAAVAQNLPLTALTEHVDSVTFCLSKGLSAPVGSLLCGTKDFIYKAHRARKMLGGGMRQAGILAAAGIVALTTMVERLSEDHARARKLADGLHEMRDLELESPATNMVFVTLRDSVKKSAIEIAEELKARGLLVGKVSERRVRMVTHYGINDGDVKDALAAWHAVLS